MSEIKTYEEMNKQICGLLKLSGDNVSLYAAQRIQELEAENDKLRARLKNAVELPTMSEFKIVDLHTNFYQIAYAVLYKNNGKLYIYQCFDKAKAEAKLKEQGGAE